MPNNWAEWDAAHGHGEGHTRSADRLAESIKKSLGGASHTGAAHGSGGSVVHRTTRKDLKRPAPVKGEKDRADSVRTKIRMAAYQRKKADATAKDPVDARTPRVEQKVNPHAGTSAAKIAAQIKGPSKVDRESESRRLQVAAPAAGQAALRSGTAEDHQKAADQYRALQAVAARKNLRDWAANRAGEHEAGVYAAKNKISAGGDYESARREAGKASIAAQGGGEAEHMKAFDAHNRAASLAPDRSRREIHEQRAHQERTMAKDAERNAAATQQPNWETLSQRAQSATVLADKSPTKENHQAASDAHQHAADAARGIDDRAAAEHREMAGRHQVVVDSKGRSQSTGKTGSMGASTKSAQPKASKPAAFTAQNMHKALESGGLTRRGDGPASRDHRGNIVQRSYGSGEGRYTLVKDSPDSTRVVVHGDRSTPAGAARHDANRAKAQSALESKGWTVRKSAPGVYGDFQVSPAPKA